MVEQFRFLVPGVLCLQTKHKSIRFSSINTEIMAPQPEKASNLLFTLTRLVIPPKPVKHMKEGNLYVRCRNGKKEFVRKLQSPKHHNMAASPHGNNVSPAYQMASKSLAELERHRALLLEERAMRERLDQEERIGFRTRRPYRCSGSGSFSSSADGPRPTPALPDPVPEIVHRHPRQYRHRHGSTTSVDSNSEGSDGDGPTEHQCATPGHPSRVRFEPEMRRCTPVTHPMPPRPSHSHSHNSHSHSPSHRHHSRHGGDHGCSVHHHHHHHRRHRHNHQRPHFDHFNDSSDEERRRRSSTFLFIPGMVYRHSRRRGSHGAGCPRAVVEERRPQDYE